MKEKISVKDFIKLMRTVKEASDRAWAKLTPEQKERIATNIINKFNKYKQNGNNNIDSSK